MDKLILGILGAATTAAIMFFFVIFGTLMGGITGWVVGLAFDAPENFAAMIGMPALTSFDIGALLGFVGGYLRSRASASATSE